MLTWPHVRSRLLKAQASQLPSMWPDMSFSRAEQCCKAGTNKGSTVDLLARSIMLGSMRSVLNNCRKSSETARNLASMKSQSAELHRGMLAKHCEHGSVKGFFLRSTPRRKQARQVRDPVDAYASCDAWGNNKHSKTTLLEERILVTRMGFGNG